MGAGAVLSVLDILDRNEGSRFSTCAAYDVYRECIYEIPRSPYPDISDGAV